MRLQVDDLGVCGVIVDDWDISKSFKPKTITTDYSSWICYISRRAVPANTPITDSYYWKPITRLQRDLAIDYNEFKDAITEEFSNLKRLVDTFLKTAGGTALDNKFGNSEFVTVNQKLLTEAINKIWNKLEDITGEPYTGIDMSVTPNYFISEEGCTVHIQAKTAEANGIFEELSFYVNGTLVAEAENTDFFETDINLTETSVIKCIAKIMGIEYKREAVITHYNSFWLGAGSSYADIMNVEHVIPITNGMRGSYDITCADNDNIIVVMSKGLRPGFIRADMNSFEIPFEETTVTINDVEYSVFTSRNTYEEGTYNIDING